MSAEIRVDQVRIDADLEIEIDRQYELMLRASDDSMAAEHFKAMALLVRQRSSEQIQRMERERRLEIKRARA